MSVRFLIFIGSLLFFDIYGFFGLKSLLSKNTNQSIYLVGYCLLVILSYVGFFTLTRYFTNSPINAELYKNLLMGFWLSFTVFKVLFSVFLLIDDIVRVLNYLFQIFSKFLGYTPTADFDERRKFLVTLGLGLASIPFASMLYGITRGKYNYKIKNIKLSFSNLPKAFDGFKVVHISDIHAGSFDSLEDVKRGVDLVNQQEPDAVFFTGDFVNSDARELEPYIDVFKSIKAEKGKFSILGNHDYGDYKKWESKKAKKENFKLLEMYQKEMGFELLKNQNTKIEKNGEQISLIGIENWGNTFVKHGDLDKALNGVSNDDFKILLSHDPSHWDLKTIPHPTPIELTLSGHTHGMQFGVEIPGFKWSPVKYKYPRWSGLYTEANQHLYVNKGFGFLGFPGRVGMWPEITVIELTTT